MFNPLDGYDPRRGSQLNPNFDRPSLLQRKSTGNENYWKERVELHIDEKKQWMKQKKELHIQVSRLQDQNDMLEKRNKHLTGVINRFGAFDNYDAEFPDR